MRLIIYGKPVPKERPRFTCRGKFAVAYKSAKQKKAEKEFITEVRRQMPEGFKKIEGPVTIEICFFMPIPKGTSKKKLNAMIINEIPHIKRPDLDNMEKFAVDCLKDLWHDDSQVVDSHTMKFYSIRPRTEIIINGL